MRVLVLGGTGAMGAPLIEKLSNRGDDVYVTSRRKHTSKTNIHYLQGNAKDECFIKQVLSDRFDAIVDFMTYSSSDFEKRAALYLSSTEQYLFLSSARVYADSKVPITENCDRLLDVCRDEAYLKTDEYALAKARSEDVLLNSKQRNWTIIRPYITYNIYRLQLGGLELSSWLPRALECGHIILPKDVADHETTMTYGDDVAEAILHLIGKPLAYGEIYHITGKENMKWVDVANIYCAVIEKITETKPMVILLEDSNMISEVMGNTYQISYDRKYNRVFNNSKILYACGWEDHTSHFTCMEEGLRKCLEAYLEIPEHERKITYDAKLEGWLDRMTGVQFSHRKLTGIKNKILYTGFYYMPNLFVQLKKIKHLNNFSAR